MLRFFLAITFALSLPMILGAKGKVPTLKIDVRLSSAQIAQKVDSLLSIMTLEEKVGQMGSIGLTAVCEGPFWSGADTLLLDEAKMRDLLIDNHVGTLLSKGKYPISTGEWYRIVKQVQDYLAKNQRVYIPAFIANDAVHGATYNAHSTIFPHEINMAASWDPSIAEQVGTITSYEFRAGNNVLNYAPDIDIAPHPQWGRGFETFGEDTYMTIQMANAFVKGSQGDNLADTTKAAVCLKHYLGYGNPAIGKDRGNAFIPENVLRQHYLPPFLNAIQSGAQSVMINSSCVNGVTVLASKYWLTDVLKKEYGFKGVLVSDWGDLAKMVDVHKVSSNLKQSAEMAVNAGLDMCMIPYDAQFCKDVVELVHEGKITQERIDDATRRILTLKYSCGLFDHPYVDPKGYTKYASDEHQQVSLHGALESITLLKNEKGILPISAVRGKKILVTGPGANSTLALNGPWSRSWGGTDPNYEDSTKLTIYKALAQQYGASNVSYVPGSTYNAEVSYADAVEAAKGVDYIIASLGEVPATEKPSDIDNLDLDPAQVELIKQLAKTGKPIIVVLQENRPRIIREIEPLVQAIFDAYWPSHQGGVALAKLISGEVSPSGKLPFTYHKFAGNIVPYNSKPCDRFGENGVFANYKPQYHFGHGLSYAKFEYSNVKVNKDHFGANDTLVVTVDVTNKSAIEAKEVVQLYFADVVASISPNMMNLVRFEKITLKSSETKTVRFTLTANDLKFVDLQNRWVIEPGDFDLMVGTSSNQTTQVRVVYQE